MKWRREDFLELLLWYEEETTSLISYQEFNSHSESLEFWNLARNLASKRCFILWRGQRRRRRSVPSSNDDDDDETTTTTTTMRSSAVSHAQDMTQRSLGRLRDALSSRAPRLHSRAGKDLESFVGDTCRHFSNKHILGTIVDDLTKNVDNFRKTAGSKRQAHHLCVIC